MDLPIAVISTETIYNFIYEKNKQIGIYFESSNNQKFFSYKKDLIFFHEKIENSDYLLSDSISHVFYNTNAPEFINKEIITHFYSLREIVLKNLKKLNFKKNIIIKPIYISNNILLN